MPGTHWLDTKHAIFGTHETAWKREERRLSGGDVVLDEVIKFGHEETDSFEARKKWARWINFARIHTTVLSGHLRREQPLPEMGQMGLIRSRAEAQGQPSLAELFYYNADGVGSDGSQLPAFMDGVEQRALATGFRWLMVEMPSEETLAAIRLRAGRQPREGEVAPTTEEDVRQGFRPFLVEYSPLAVTNWRFRDGVLVWAIIRIPVESERDFASEQVTGDGYYLLVRGGYTGLGDEFKEGGWWKYDASKKQLDHRRWDDTDGQIPMWLHLGEPGNGTFERPSIGQSSTMELGQISADLMNAQSEQRFNARQAAKSVNYFLGIDTDSHSRVIEQLGDGQIMVGVKASVAPDGSIVVPSVWNSSAAALDTEVYKTIIDSAIAEAKEIMVRQVTSTPEASGVSKEAGFAEATSPLLARIAATAEQSWNTMLYFVARRFGIARPTASIQLPREYELRNVLDSIDQMLVTIKETGMNSPAWVRSLVQRKGDELDLLPEEEREAVEAELTEASRLQIQEQRAKALAALIAADALMPQAAIEVGYTPEEARRLFGEMGEPERDEDEDANPPPLRGVA
jgi:hypothetical protein